MSRLLYRLGHFCGRHRHVVLAAWVVILVGTVVGGRVAGTASSDNLTLPGTDSTEATDILDESLPKQANGTNPIVIKTTSGTLDKRGNQKAVKATVASLEKSPWVRRSPHRARTPAS